MTHRKSTDMKLVGFFVLNICHFHIAAETVNANTMRPSLRSAVTYSKSGTGKNVGFIYNETNQHRQEHTGDGAFHTKLLTEHLLNIFLYPRQMFRLK